MDKAQLLSLLNDFKNGNISADDAVLKFKEAPFEDLGFAKIDHHRALRQGIAEVIYGASKNPDQILKIAQSAMNAGQKTVLITRMKTEAAGLLEKELGNNLRRASCSRWKR